MAWVRWDDQIAGNQKITAAAAEDLASVGLYSLARPWTNTQAISGYVPAHQPGVIAVDKRKGPKLAAILVKHGLWHRRGEECPACQKRIAEDCWPHHDDGYVIHDWWKYNAPERDRTTAGTPAEISEKRRQAGRNGGLKSAARREQTRREVEANSFGGQANEANGQAKRVSKTSDLLPADASKASKPASNGVTPVPVVAPNGATTGPEPVPPTAGFASNPEAKPDASAHWPPRHVGDVVAAYVDGARAGKQPDPASSLRARVGRQAGELVADGFSLEVLATAAKRMGAGEWNDLAVQVRKDAATAAGAGSPAGPQARRQQETNEWLGRAMGRAREQEAAEAAAIAGGTA